MATTDKLPSRLHHNAYVSKDLEATRAFYEGLIGLPLVATWSEADELFGAKRVYCHTFFGLGDGSALGVLPVRPRRGPEPVRSRPDAVAVPAHRAQGHARAAGRDPPAPHGRRLEARRHLRPRARLLPVALHRGPERPAPGVHGRRRRGGRHRGRAPGRQPRDPAAVAGRRPHQQQRLPLVGARGTHRGVGSTRCPAATPWCCSCTGPTTRAGAGSWSWTGSSGWASPRRRSTCPSPATTTTSRPSGPRSPRPGAGGPPSTSWATATPGWRWRPEVTAPPT